MTDRKMHPSNEKGMTLVTVMLLVAVLVVLGTTAVMMSTMDRKISGNYKTSNEAFYAAEAGIEEARTRLLGTNAEADYVGDPATTPNLLWSSYIVSSSEWAITDDATYNASYTNYVPTTSSHTSTTFSPNSVQSNISYLVKMKHKTEYDAEQAGHSTTNPHYEDNDGSTALHTAAAPGNFIYYGYNASIQLVQYTTAAATSDEVIKIVTSYGRSGNGKKVIFAEVAKLPPVAVPAALYARGTVTTNGSSQNIDGRDNCFSPPTGSNPPIYTMTPSVTGYSGVGMPTFNGATRDPLLYPVYPNYPTNPVMGPIDINITTMVDVYGTTYDQRIEEDLNGGTYGSPSNYVTVYSDTNNPYLVQGLSVSNVTGYGILVVRGDLTLNGGFTWNGLVICSGTITFNGGGLGVNINGAVLANTTVTMNGGLDLRYNGCQLANAFQRSSMQILSWKEGM